MDTFEFLDFVIFGAAISYIAYVIHTLKGRTNRFPETARDIVGFILVGLGCISISLVDAYFFERNVNIAKFPFPFSMTVIAPLTLWLGYGFILFALLGVWKKLQKL